MYAPGPVGPAGKNRWVELHNPTSAAIDVGGWFIWTDSTVAPDTLEADAFYSTGSTVIPSGGYALVTDRDSQLYLEELTNGDFERGNPGKTGMGAWEFDNGLWQRTTGDAYSGSYYIQLPGDMWTTMHQDFKIVNTCAKARLLVRARVRQEPATSGRLIIRITNRKSTVLLDVYDGPLTVSWATFSADLTSLINANARLEILAYSLASAGGVCIDATAVHGSRLPTHALDGLHFWVDDDEIGSDLQADQQALLADGGLLHDVVVFETGWGGDGDGSTLSRTGPFAPSIEQEGWESGPYGGTPGAQN